MDDISAPTQALLQLPVKPSTLFRSMCEGGGGCNRGNDDGNPDWGNPLHKASWAQ